MRRAEQVLIRLMILSSVVLAIIQMGSAKDPVDFYLAMAAKVESPPLDIPATDYEAKKTYLLSLKAVPQVSVKVWQNGTLLGDLGQGEKLISVQAGEIVLDGRGAGQPVRVQLLPKDAALREPRANIIPLNGNLLNIKVSP